jgi:predicted GIY-YIG superfamily endonuclease
MLSQYLYIIQSDKTGSLKIGRSKNPERRLKQLQTGSPYKLKLIFAAESKGHMEKPLHERLKRFKERRRGEWFDFECTGSLPDWIYEMINWDEANVWWDKR